MFDRLIASDPPPEHRWSAGATLVFANLLVNGVLVMFTPREARYSPVRADTSFVICDFGDPLPLEPYAFQALLVVHTGRGVAIEHIDQAPDGGEGLHWSDAWLSVSVQGDSIHRVNAGPGARPAHLLLEAVLDSAGRLEPASVRVLHGTNGSVLPFAMRYLGAIAFRPVRLHERPVRVLVRIPIDFKLRPGS